MKRERAPAGPGAPHGFRRMASVAKIGDAGLAETITATPKELAKIATHLRLPEVKRLSAEIALTRWRGKGVRVSGCLSADVVQTCVVTLDPLDAHVEATFERRFLPEEKLEGEAHDVFVDPDAEDPPEPLTHEIDLGEMLVEELSLNLDPYPRKPGVAFEGTADQTRGNPFAVLAKLKPGKKDEG